MHIGSLVTSSEHPHSIGEITAICGGDLTIKWITPPSPKLPFGHIGMEWWSSSDAQQLVTVSSA